MRRCSDEGVSCINDHDIATGVEFSKVPPDQCVAIPTDPSRRGGTSHRHSYHCVDRDALSKYFKINKIQWNPQSSKFERVTLFNNPFTNLPIAQADDECKSRVSSLFLRLPRILGDFEQIMQTARLLVSQISDGLQRLRRPSHFMAGQLRRRIRSFRAKLARFEARVYSSYTTFRDIPQDLKEEYGIPQIFTEACPPWRNLVNLVNPDLSEFFWMQVSQTRPSRQVSFSELFGFDAPPRRPRDSMPPQFIRPVALEGRRSRSGRRHDSPPPPAEAPGRRRRSRSRSRSTQEHTQPIE